MYPVYNIWDNLHNHIAYFLQQRIVFKVELTVNSSIPPLLKQCLPGDLVLFY